MVFKFLTLCLKLLKFWTEKFKSLRNPFVVIVLVAWVCCSWLYVCGINFVQIEC